MKLDNNMYISVSGTSKIFHDERDIKSIWNVINPCTNHEHSTNMSPRRKQWFVINMCQVCLQMFDTEGNIAIFCKSGRSRSPMYLVSYLLLFNDMTVDNALNHVGLLLRVARNEWVDRHYSLYDIVVLVACIKTNNYT